MPAEELRRRQLAALTNWVMAGARVQPVVLAVEDLHWADPTTLDVLRGIAERGALAPLFVLITARPGVSASHGVCARITAPSRSRRSITSRSGTWSVSLRLAHALPTDVIEGVTERTGGVPLFVEEVTRLLLERGEQGGIQAIPPTLQQSLTARLDRLGPAREVAQIGIRDRTRLHLSLAARRGRYGGRAAAGGTGTARGSRHPAGSGPAAGIRLSLQARAHSGRGLREFAQEPSPSLAPPRRRSIARRSVLVPCGEPELLAHHFTQAGLTELAIEWWGKAGQRSLQRSALVEGIEQLTRALALIATLPATPALRRQAINFNVALITPLYHVKGAAAPETKMAAERARLLIQEAEALGESPEDPLLLFSVLYGFWVANLVAFNGDIVRELSSQFLALAEKQAGTVPLMVGHRLKGVSLTYAGKFAEARTHLDRAIAPYSRAEHGALARQFGQDVHVAALAYLSLSSWFLGYPDAALAMINQALRDAREVGDATTLMYALGHAALIHTHAQKYEAAEAESAEDIALANEKGSPFWVAFGTTTRGAVSALTGRASEAVQIMTSGLAMLRSTGTAMWLPFYLSCLARAYTDLAQFDDAWDTIGEAATAIETTGETWCEAEVHRTAGEIALKSDGGERRKRISSARSRLRDNSRRSPWNCAPR